MPPREPKGRFFTREYMADADFMRSHDAAARELYMMLALFTDDAGWLEWDADYLAYACYRYDPERTGVFATGVESLAARGRLRVYRCGHAFMPKVASRPRVGVHEFHVKEEHESICNRRKTKGNQSGIKAGPYLTLPNPNLDLTKPIPTESSPRGRARGGAPRSLKEIVKWEPSNGQD